MEQIQKKLAAKASAALSKKQHKAGRTSTESAGFVEFLPYKDNGLGGFPYYYSNPCNLLFNDKTYRWICSSCSFNGTSIELHAPFTNIFIEALSSISFQLSAADQSLFAQFKADISTKQMNLISCWRQTYPSQSNIQIDAIIETIANSWAQPSTTLHQMLTAQDLHSLLNCSPASGQAILLPLSAYLSAINRSVSLKNASSMHNGYLAQALAGVQTPTMDNGGMQTTSSVRPKFAVATALSDILTSLNSSSTGNFSINVALDCLANNQCKAVIDGELSEQTNLVNVLDITFDDDACFSQLLDVNDTINATMAFTGVSIVEFLPQAFDKSEGKYWYWNAAIAKAITNKNKDVTGFQFSPMPSIDFSVNGKYGYLTSVAISKHPGVRLQITSSKALQIKKAFEQAQKIALTFIGRQMLMSSPADINIVDEKLTISLTQTETFMPDSVDSTAFVLGVKACFPNAPASPDEI